MSLINQDIVPEVLTEFLEIAVHCILYARKIYPDTIFVKKHKYSVVVYKSIHPQLNEYISECIKAAYHLIKANQLRKFVICFTKLGHFCEEKFVFDVSSVQSIFEKDPYLLEIEKNLRIFCLKLNSSLAYLEPLPDDISFNIQIHTTETGSVECMENPIFENFPWININSNEVQMRGSEIVPLQTIVSSCIKLQLYIQTYSS